VTNRFKIASFLLRRNGASHDVEQLTEQAGMDGTQWGRPAVELGRERALCGRWDGLSVVWAYLDEFAYHICLNIAFADFDFYLLQEKGSDAPDDLAADGALPLAHAFRAACESLRPEIALLAVLPQQTTPGWIAEHYSHIANIDLRWFAEEHFAMLYLDERLAPDWPRVVAREPRDTLPVSSGVLVFASRGAQRWL
jgi:hypothetical protein